MKIHYTLNFENAVQHYIKVGLKITEINDNFLELFMPVWTPGSYMVREFSKNIDAVFCIENTIKTKVEKVAKNRWIIDTKNKNEIFISYNLYGYEPSVRTNFITDDYATLNGAATFLAIKNYENITYNVIINPAKNWKNISTSLPIFNNNKWHRIADNYDTLVDSPIIIGNHTSCFFEVENIPHEIAIEGKSNCNMEILITDLQKIISEEIKIFGSHPCKNYVFIIVNTHNLYGGLEHLHSSLNYIPRFDYFPRQKYLKSISLLAHEYFHLWNIKRIRPIELGPFNYNEENYTKQLWLAEGITSYYDDYICYNAGVYTKTEYLDILVNNINLVLNTTGNELQSLAESSFDAWIKYYRQNENSNNTQVSYYTKGTIIALALNCEILHISNGKYSLNNVLKDMYNAYLQKPNIGFTELQTKQFFTKYLETDFVDFFFDNYIYNTTKIDIENYLSKVGIDLIAHTSNDFYLGIKTTFSNNKLTITSVEKDTCAYNFGLNAEDEILAIDNYRVTQDYEKIVANKKVDDTVNFLIARNGIIKEINVVLQKDKNIVYAYTINTKNDLYKIWLCI